MYINDLTNDLKCNVKLFADDTSLFTVVNEPNAAAEDMNNDLELIRKWLMTGEYCLILIPKNKLLNLYFQQNEIK